MLSSGAQPWILASPDQLILVRRLERDFPAIEEVGCKVGIGVATGADKAFIGPFNELDVEEDRKLPLVMTRDIGSGEVKWRGLGIVNPFADSGGLVNLNDYPRLKKYLEQRRDQIAKRHVAQKSAGQLVPDDRPHLPSHLQACRSCLSPISRAKPILSTRTGVCTRTTIFTSSFRTSGT